MSFRGLRADALTLQRSGRTLFHNLSWTLHAADLLLITGANGTGKSSLLRALLGLSPLSHGQLVCPATSTPIAPRHLCPQTLYQGHALGIKGALTVRDNLQSLAALDGSPHHTMHMAAALHRVGLGRCAHLEGRRLSAGQRQRLQLARFALALAHSTRRLWLMDEPSAALDSDGSAILAALLAEHLQTGGAALIATHRPIAPPGYAPRELHLGAAAPLQP